MEWADELRQFRAEVDAFRLERASRLQIEEAARQSAFTHLKETFEELHVKALLEEMSRHLLDGQGQVILYLPWEPSDQAVESPEVESDDGSEEESEDEDVASAILSWEEEGERQVVVDLGMGERGVYLQVNGADVRVRDDALREALKRAFGEELEL